LLLDALEKEEHDVKANNPIVCLEIGYELIHNPPEQKSEILGQFRVRLRN